MITESTTSLDRNEHGIPTELVENNIKNNTKWLTIQSIKDIQTTLRNSRDFVRGAGAIPWYIGTSQTYNNQSDIQEHQAKKMREELWQEPGMIYSR
jgi:hypothetical protein